MICHMSSSLLEITPITIFCFSFLRIKLKEVEVKISVDRESLETFGVSADCLSERNLNICPWVGVEFQPDQSENLGIFY